MLNIATWNILLEEDEFSRDWGSPLSIAKCPVQSSCVAGRWQRLWGKLEEVQQSQKLQVVLIQEIEDGFLQLQPSGSKWEMAIRSGECAILVSSDTKVHRTYELGVNELPFDGISGLSGCPAIPMAVVSLNEEEDIHVGSVHLRASVDLATWFDMVLPTQTPSNGTMILGGDFNQNLTEFDTVHDWLVLDIDVEKNLLGTSQREYNWMGNLDGFIMYSAGKVIEHTKPTAPIQEGFMPKNVKGYPQGGAVNEVAQFRWEDPDLLFSPTSSFQNDTLVIPLSHPVEEVLSDHLMIVLTLGSPTVGSKLNGTTLNPTQQPTVNAPAPDMTIPPSSSGSTKATLSFPLVLLTFTSLLRLFGKK